MMLGLARVAGRWRSCDSPSRSSRGWCRRRPVGPR